MKRSGTLGNTSDDLTSPGGAQENAHQPHPVLQFSFAPTGTFPCVGSHPRVLPDSSTPGYHPTVLRGLLVLSDEYYGQAASFTNDGWPASDERCLLRTCPNLV